MWYDYPWYIYVGSSFILCLGAWWLCRIIYSRYFGSKDVFKSFDLPMARSAAAFFPLLKFLPNFSNVSAHCCTKTVIFGAMVLLAYFTKKSFPSFVLALLMVLDVYMYLQRRKQYKKCIHGINDDSGDSINNDLNRKDKKRVISPVMRVYTIIPVYQFILWQMLVIFCARY